jgi:hypothetical protein
VKEDVMERLKDVRLSGLLVVLALMGLAACVPAPGNTTGNCTGLCGDVTFGPTGVPTASPGPGSGSDTLPAGSTVRVGLFGMSCPSGVPVPNNGARQIPAGCTGYLTATPKDPGNTDLPPAVHGPNCAWRSDGVIDLFAATEAFNQDARCPAPGDSTVTATVKNVSGSVGIACLPANGSRTFGPPTFVWFEGDELPAAPRLALIRRDAIVRELDRWEHMRDEAK